MDHFRLKNLIVKFLALTIVLSSGIFAFQTLTKGLPSNAEKHSVDESDVQKIPENAFVKSLPDDAGSSLTADSNDNGAVTARTANSQQANIDAHNLTQQFVQRITMETLKQNPGGPLNNSDGSQTLMLPTEDYTAQMIMDTIKKNKGKINLFSSTSSIPNEKLQIINNPNNNDIQRYISQINSVLSGSAELNKSINLILNQGPNANSVHSAKISAEGSIYKLENMPVPKNLVSLHKSIITLFYNQENIFDSVENYESDPLKSLIVLDSSEQIVDRDINDLVKELQKANKIIGVNTNHSQKSSHLSFITSIFEIKKAHALFGVFDIVFDPQAFAQMLKDALRDIKKWIYETILRTLVNQIINHLQNQVLSWIAGGGNPKFITNWQDFLKNSASEAAGEAIRQIAPGLCGYIGPALRVSLQQPPYVYEYTQCTMEDVIRNVKGFYNDFRNGGWVSYSYILQPQNNYYTNLITAHDIVYSKAAEAAEAAKSKGIASQGFKGVEVCTKYGAPVVKDECVRYETRNGEIVCAEHKTVEEKVCLEKQTVTPGAAVSHALAGAINWKENQIVSAKRLLELVQAIIDAATNKIIQKGLSSLSSVMSSKGTSGNISGEENVPGTINIGGSSVNINTGNAGGTETSGISEGSINDIRQSIIDSINSDIHILDSASSSYNLWMSIADETINLLNSASQECPSLSTEAQDTINKIESDKLSVNSSLAKISSIKSALKLFMAQAESAKTIDQLDFVNNNIADQIDYKEIQNIKTDADGKLNSIQNINAVAKNALVNPPSTCPQNLPQ